jgi:hypothetical protein
MAELDFSDPAENERRLREIDALLREGFHSYVVGSAILEAADTDASTVKDAQLEFVFSVLNDIEEILRPEEDAVPPEDYLKLLSASASDGE